MFGLKSVFTIILYFPLVMVFLGACSGIETIKKTDGGIQLENNEVAQTPLTTEIGENNEGAISGENLCFSWRTVDSYFVGQEICVYGTIKKLESTTKYPIIAGFSEEPGTLVIRGEYGGFDFEIGQCVLVRGLIFKEPTYLYMDSSQVEGEITYGCK